MNGYRISYNDDRRYSDPATQSEVEEWAAAVERGDPEYMEATAECMRLLRQRRLDRKRVAALPEGWTTPESGDNRSREREPRGGSGLSL